MEYLRSKNNLCISPSQDQRFAMIDGNFMLRSIHYAYVCPLIIADLFRLSFMILGFVLCPVVALHCFCDELLCFAFVCPLSLDLV